LPRWARRARSPWSPVDLDYTFHFFFFSNSSIGGMRFFLAPGAGKDRRRLFLDGPLLAPMSYFFPPLVHFPPTLNVFLRATSASLLFPFHSQRPGLSSRDPILDMEFSLPYLPLF